MPKYCMNLWKFFPNNATPILFIIEAAALKPRNYILSLPPSPTSLHLAGGQHFE